MKAINAYRAMNAFASRAAMAVAKVLLIYMVLHILLEILLRSFFATSTYSMDEYVGYAIGTMTFLSLSHTFAARRHIRVGILQTFLRGQAAVAVEIVCIVLTFAITLFLARFVWRMLARDFLRGSVSPTLNQTPIWLIEAAIFTGLVLFLMQLVASVLETLQDGVRSDEVAGD